MIVAGATTSYEIMITLDELSSPIGPLTLAEKDGRVCLLHFGSRSAPARATLARWYPDEPIGRGLRADLRRTLDAYFAGDLDALDRIDVEMNGTPFQRRVWDALRRIAAGTTTSYGALARSVGEPSAVRAVGAANGANPVAVIVPCHRVIGSNGSLTGYGGGLDRKKWLLAHEARHSGLFAVRGERTGPRRS
jgi:methylated-DNA-[protein]-cysteine S-methyltransferase